MRVVTEHGWVGTPYLELFNVHDVARQALHKIADNTTRPLASVTTTTTQNVCRHADELEVQPPGQLEKY